MIWMVSREDVREEFKASGATKHEIAAAISRQFPELAQKLPPKTKLWASEPQRMNIFDAMSFALTALSHLERLEL